jgi:hypothetical protein
MSSKSNDHRFFIRAQNRETRFCLTRFAILNRLALAPFCDRFDIDTEFPAQRRDCSLQSLYCCSDGVRSRGAAVTYLSHNASFHSKKQIAPSNRGTERLGTSSANGMGYAIIDVLKRMLRDHLRFFRACPL